MARGSQETPQSTMNLLLGTVLLLLVLPDAVRGQQTCADLDLGDGNHRCCSTAEQGKEDAVPLSLDLPQHCPELRHTSSLGCTCLRQRWLSTIQSETTVPNTRLKVLLLNISRAVTRDVLITFCPKEGPSMLNTMDKGEAGKIQLPREIFQSLSQWTVRVVVTVLNIHQLGMFEEVNQIGQVLDNTVVGITVGEMSISGLRDPVQLRFAHKQLPSGVTPQCVFWDASKGQTGGWNSSGCVTQPGDKGTVCLCNHLTFFTLLLNPALDRSTARTLKAVATAGCGVAMAFSIFTIAFCIFLRYRFRSEETLRINVGLHMNFMGSLLLLNLAFLLNSGLSAGTQLGTCKVLGGLTHYCLLCCFTWMALEGCHLYLLFVKVLGTYIHHYLAKLCLVGWALQMGQGVSYTGLVQQIQVLSILLGTSPMFIKQVLYPGVFATPLPAPHGTWRALEQMMLQRGFPALVVGVAGIIGSYGEHIIQTVDHQVIAHLCWITSKHLLVHYITNCGYFVLIFLFSMAVFGVVIHKSCCLQGTGATSEGRKAWKVALVALGLFCLLGTTWALAFLTHSTSSAPILYLFTVLNSLQGIFIFIWLVILYYPKAKETTNSLSHIIRHDKTTTASQD